VSYIYIYIYIYILKPQNEEKFKFESQIFGMRILEFHVIDYYECKFYQDCDCLVGIFGIRYCKSMCSSSSYVSFSLFFFKHGEV
jgi:hypothetical protein